MFLHCHLLKYIVKLNLKSWVVMSLLLWFVGVASLFVVGWFFGGGDDVTSILPVWNFTHSGRLHLSTVQYQERPDRGMTWLIQVPLILKQNLHAN